MVARPGTLLMAVVTTLIVAAGPAHAEDGEQSAAAKDEITNPFADRDDLVPKGRTLYNVHCSHCHGPNAFQGERPRDLRRLSLRYGDDMAEVFLSTALNGRPEKGMPPWKGVMDEEELWTIFTFLRTVQK